MLILVCIDLSPLTPAIASEAVTLAAAMGATLELVHVAKCAPVPDVAQIVPPEDMEYRTGELDALTARLDAAGAKVTSKTVLTEGAVHTAIVEEAERSGAALVVVGSHARGRAFELLVGSVTQAVIRAARVPVVVVNGLGRTDAPK